MHSKLLSQRCEDLCCTAKRILAEVIAKVESGVITLRELEQMKKRREHISKLLFESVLRRDGGKGSFKLLLEQRFKEYDEFKNRVCLLRQLCQNVKVQVKGIIIIVIVII